MQFLQIRWLRLMLQRNTGIKMKITIQESLQHILTEEYQPMFLNIENQSDRHLHHQSGPTQKGAETHFSITLVSAHFINMTRLERHKHVYVVLDSFLKNDIHALALKLMTPEEYQSGTR